MWYKGTLQECEAYNLEISINANYNGTTQKWDEIREIEGSYFIRINVEYSSTMEVITELPIISEI